MDQTKPDPHSSLRPVHPVHQNWFQKFLGIRPAVATMCFQVSSVRARKEMVSILHGWKRYGMRDIVVDKAAGRIFARVATDNCTYLSHRCRRAESQFPTSVLTFDTALHIRPVSLVIEIHLVLFRGRRANLSIARFTQEKGAKSSFERVVEAMERIMDGKGLLVADAERVQGMVLVLEKRLTS